MNRIALILAFSISSLTSFSQSNTWTVTGNDIYNTNSGNVGIGTNNPQYKLDVLGNVRISNNLSVGGGIITSPTVNATGEINGGDVNIGNLLNVNGSSIFNGSFKISSLSGAGVSPVFVDNNGFLFKDPLYYFWPCWNTNLAWNPGGNNFGAIQSSNPPPSDIGTCDDYDFMLKAANVRRQWIKPDGTIGFGTNITSNTGGPEYRFKTGVIRLQNTNTYGGPQIIFDLDDSSTPYGEWGIEYTKALPGKDGLNFWKPFGSFNSNNNLLFLADDGMVGVGTDNPTFRFTVDAWADDGIKVGTNNGKKAISSINKNSNTETFTVFTDGQTIVGYQPNSPNSAFLNINCANSQRAIDIYDQQTNAVNFRVYSTGFVYAREIEVRASTFPDYVFDREYNLMSLSDLEIFIKKNKRLPGFENADYYVENGMKTGELIIKQQEKIEELTLYIIELKKKLENIEAVLNKK